ncbi:cyclophilin-like domain-containing protein [Pelagophyceae sp. CCMP2097]|nr:cyclophilin-like domain-containing protein [Pelagophyceae sp. CCMP2097]
MLLLRRGARRLDATRLPLAAPQRRPQPQPQPQRRPFCAPPPPPGCPGGGGGGGFTTARYVVYGVTYVGVIGAGYLGAVELGLMPKLELANVGASFQTVWNLITGKQEDDGVLAVFATPPPGAVTERVFFDVEADGEVGRITLGLYGAACPRTVKNFSTLCASESPIMGYKGTKFHRIIPKFMLQSGDFTRGDGTGGNSIYGGPFKDESFEHKHTGAGVLSMANRGPDTQTSQFFITCAATPHLDGKHVVFGCVVDGFETVRRIEKLGSRSGKPSKPVRIVSCGGLERTREEAENYVAFMTREK